MNFVKSKNICLAENEKINKNELELAYLLLCPLPHPPPQKMKTLANPLCLIQSGNKSLG